MTRIIIRPGGRPTVMPDALCRRCGGIGRLASVDQERGQPVRTIDCPECGGTGVDLAADEGEGR